MDYFKEEGFLDHKQQAEFFGITETSLSSAICRGTYTYPRYQVGKRKLARKEDILKSIEETRKV